VEKPAYANTFSDTLGGFPDLVDLVVAKRDRRERATRVTGVDSGLLNVFHDATYVQLLTVVECVNIDLDSIIEEPVDEQGVAWADQSASLDPLKIFSK